MSTETKTTLSAALDAVAREHEELLNLRAAVRVQATETQRQRERAEQAERERERWEDCAHSAGAAVMEANEIEAAAVARATAAEGQAQALRAVVDRWERLHEGHTVDCEEVQHRTVNDGGSCICSPKARPAPPAQAAADALRAERDEFEAAHVAAQARWDVLLDEREVELEALRALLREALTWVAAFDPEEMRASASLRARIGAALAGKPEVAKAGTEREALMGFFLAADERGMTNCYIDTTRDSLSGNPVHSNALGTYPPEDCPVCFARALWEAPGETDEVMVAEGQVRAAPTAPAKAEVPPALECPPSSITGARCLLPAGHAPHSATRFHKYREPFHPDPEINAEVEADVAAGEAVDRAAGLLPPPAASKEEHSE